MRFCDFDNDGLTCPACGKKAPSRVAKSNCLAALNAAEIQALIPADAKENELTVSVNHGPGTELKALLAGWPFRIVSSPDCKCNARARYMDEKGCDWCESPEGMAEIMGFLREAAEERGLPFLDLPARLLVKRAIHNARRKESVADAEGSSHHDRREALAPPGDAPQG
jgi:hypothetical protein